MSANELSSAARAGLAELVAPLREQLNQLDAAIIEVVAELDDLRKTRAQITKTLALLDPEPAAKKEPKKSEVAAPTLDRILKWLQERRDEINANGGFSGPDLFRNYSYDLTSDATLNHALRTLHERGTLRLDRRGTGGSKIYKLVGHG